MTSPLLFIVIAGLSNGLANTIRKISSTTLHRATTITTTTMLVNGIISLPLLAIQFHLPTNPFTWILVLCSVVIFAISATFMFKSYQQTDLSLSSILQRSSIIFVAIFGVIFLGDRLSIQEIFGIVLLFFSSVIILYTSKKIIISPGLWYATLSAIFSAIAAILDKKIISDFSPYTYAVINNVLVGCVFLWRKNTLQESIQFVQKYPIHIIASSFFGSASYIVILVILQTSQVSETMALYKTISFFIPVLLGIMWFKENNKLLQKILGTACAILGILFLYL